MSTAPRAIPSDVMPLAPYIQYGEKEPQSSGRLSHLDCLQPEKMRQGLKANTVCTLNQVADMEIGLVNVYSPYADLAHVMMLSLGSQHCPGPCCMSNDAGDQIMAVAAQTLNFLRKHGANDLFLGWNFSPWSWGDVEMKSGGQSFPTRFHPHLGARSQGEVKMLEWDQLSHHQRRLMGSNDYGCLLGEAILSRLECTAGLLDHIEISDAYTDNMGLVLPLRRDLATAIGSHGFFTDVVATVSNAAELTIKNLSFAMTSLSGSFLCQHLRKVEDGRWEEKDLEILMADPQMRSKGESLDLFQEYRFDPRLLDVLKPYVHARCAKEESMQEDWWRKGFAYSAVFHYEPNQGPILRVAPYVTVGPCGLHEAQGRLLSRPLDCKMSTEEILKRSRLLWDLADLLRTKDLAK